MPSQKIPGDRLVLATISVLRTLIHELSRRGVVDPEVSSPWEAVKNHPTATG
jgi:hypothetical protein